MASRPPAPGDLEILQSLLNTWKPSQGVDALRSPRALASWLSRWRLMPATAELTDADVQRIVHVREGLRAHLRTHTGAPLDEAAAERLGDATIGARIEVRIDRDGTARFEPASLSFSDTVGLLLGAGGDGAAGRPLGAIQGLRQSCLRGGVLRLRAERHREVVP